MVQYLKIMQKHYKHWLIKLTLKMYTTYLWCPCCLESEGSRNLKSQAPDTDVCSVRIRRRLKVLLMAMSATSYQQISTVLIQELPFPSLFAYCLATLGRSRRPLRGCRWLGCSDIVRLLVCIPCARFCWVLHWFRGVPIYHPHCAHLVKERVSLVVWHGNAAIFSRKYDGMGKHI